MTLVAVGEARAAAEAALLRVGATPETAALQADLLIEAELRGTPSHGLLRLERLIRRIGNGVADPVTTGSHTWRGEALLHVDGQNGLGPVVADAAIRAISERARRFGVGVASIMGSNHIGMLAYFVEGIARRGQIGIALTTSEALVHPYGGRVALLGTNPIAIGIPTAEGPFVIDLATSLVSMGEIHDRAHRGLSIPEGWALDEHGEPTTDPNLAKRGAIAPFGGAKGYALGLAFELLVSSLAGAALGREVKGTLDDTALCNKGDVFIVIEGDSGQGEVLSRYLETIRQTPPEAGFERVLIPNEQSLARREERMRTGLPLADAVWENVMRLSEEGRT